MSVIPHLWGDLYPNQQVLLQHTYSTPGECTELPLFHQQSCQVFIGISLLGIDKYSCWQIYGVSEEIKAVYISCREACGQYYIQRCELHDNPNRTCGPFDNVINYMPDFRAKMLPRMKMDISIREPRIADRQFIPGDESKRISTGVIDGADAMRAAYTVPNAVFVQTSDVCIEITKHNEMIMLIN